MLIRAFICIVPTRLFALKHGAKLVWSPEIVDKAILHTERVVDRTFLLPPALHSLTHIYSASTGVVSYNGASKAIFTTHPLERPYLIYQIGSSDPQLAVQAAQTVLSDISGVDLNCGCPKPFSTHAGMGAALLSTPDKLCAILTALREALPREISVSAKIRLLPSQEDTIELVKRIVGCGVDAITVHCRTRNMRPREKALVERMKEVVEAIEETGRGVAVIENGDCVSWEDAKRIRGFTLAHSCMIATAAEANPTCFSPTPLSDLERTFVPGYLKLARYLCNHWSSTKFCVTQFKGVYKDVKKAERQKVKDMLTKAKRYEDVDEIVGSTWNGEEVLNEIRECVEARERDQLSEEHSRETSVTEATMSDGTTIDAEVDISGDGDLLPTTPFETRENPEPAALDAPKMPLNGRLKNLPALILGRDAPTPSPEGPIRGRELH